MTIIICFKISNFIIVNIKSKYWDAPKFSPVTLIVDPTLGLSGIILNVDSENISPIIVLNIFILCYFWILNN